MRHSFFAEAFEAAPVGMLVVDEAGLIIHSNQRLQALFGYSRAELDHAPLEQLVPGRASDHRLRCERFFAQPSTRPMGNGRDLSGRHHDGHLVPVEIGLTPMTTDEGSFVLACVVDLSERKRSQALLEESLAEKETLLRELHHRAKNNLALIASLLDLAAERPGPRVLAEVRERISSVSLVHELLYQRGTFSRIPMNDYVRTLAEQVAHAWARPEGPQVSVVIEADAVQLPLEHAVPCGLVLNELLTNAFKHAFPHAPGEVRVTLSREGRRVSLSVADDGVGLPPDRRSAGGIGLDLVDALARQLRATVEVDLGRGTSTTIRFEATS